MEVVYSKFVRPVAGVLFCLAALLSGGCGSLMAPAAPADVAQASAEWLESQKPVIAARAEARWKALIAGDFKRSYEFETPEYRSVFSAQQYQGKFGTAVAWQVAKVQAVEYDPGNVARVSVDVEYVAPLRASQDVRGVRRMMEKWLYSGGVWWYISQ